MDGWTACWRTANPCCLYLPAGCFSSLHWQLQSCFVLLFRKIKDASRAFATRKEIKACLAFILNKQCDLASLCRPTSVSSFLHACFSREWIDRSEKDKQVLKTPWCGGLFPLKIQIKAEMHFSCFLLFVDPDVVFIHEVIERVSVARLLHLR